MMDVKTAKHLLRKEVIDLRIGYICTKKRQKMMGTIYGRRINQISIVGGN